VVENNRLHDLYGALQKELAAKLAALRQANVNAEAKGDASEHVWNELLHGHLPHRYHVSKGFVIDADGAESQFIDVIIYDRHYTPCIFNREGNLYIPAESVYAILEAKQNLNKQHVEYAGDKAESVRKLRRTSAYIKHAGGNFEPKAPGPIVAGILAYDSSWQEPFGKPLEDVLIAASPSRRLDLGIAVAHGAFEVDYGSYGTQITRYQGGLGLAAFLIRLLARLQDLGTVPAIDYNEYSKMLK
jgi:hypothetical protein